MGIRDFLFSDFPRSEMVSMKRKLRHVEPWTNGHDVDPVVADDQVINSGDEQLEFGSEEAESDEDIFSHGPSETESDEEPDLEEDSIREEKDANGNARYLYRDVDTAYASDDSDALDTTNTIGNIPLSYYDSYPHIGYNINGKKISRPAKGQALDALLDSIDLPEGWTGLTDPNTGEPLQLNRQELEVLKRVTRHEMPEDGFDMYPDMVEYFSGKLETMPLSSAPEPKRRFVPSKHEAKRVMKIVRAIRDGRIQPYRSPDEVPDQQPERTYDIWADEKPRSDVLYHIPAPKLPPPGYEESYHPPPEYLPNAQERKEWQDLDEEDRKQDYLATDHDALRKVSGYERFVKEKFERCLDLYLAPRIRRTKLNIDPEALLPRLPSPEELRPFPAACAVVFRGSHGRVRSLAIDPQGIWVATGHDKGVVAIWELLTGRCIWQVKLSKDEPINVVRWRPEGSIICAAVGTDLHFLVPQILDPETERRARDVLDAGWGYAAKKAEPATWSKPGSRLAEMGVMVSCSLRAPAKVISWHRRGEYLSTVSPTGQSSAVAIHTLSKHQTQLPFRKLKGIPQAAHFHPSKPVFFVATQHSIRSYDLARQELLKIIQPGARWISSFDVHPGGDNLIVGSYDKRLLWHDLELSTRPYKTLRYHQRAIRAVRFHPGGLPLFADASDDGSVQVFHGKVVDDAMENASIVPLKVLKGHTVTRELGVLDIDWHARYAWCASAGADGTSRLWM